MREKRKEKKEGKGSTLYITPSGMLPSSVYPSSMYPSNNKFAVCSSNVPDASLQISVNYLRRGEEGVEGKRE